MHYAFTIPVLPGKSDMAREFTQEVLGPRKGEYDDLQRRWGVEEERYFLEQSPEGDIVIVTGIGSWSNPADILDIEANPFDRWFVGKVQEISGVNLLEQASEAPELMGEWKP